MDLIMVGINFRTASIEVREKISFASSRVSGTLRNIISEFGDIETTIISTCNRTELYCAGKGIDKKKDTLVEALLKNADLESSDDLKKKFYHKTNIEAAEHLAAVASSLDSMVVGETEVLGQVKDAYAVANEIEDNCKVLHSLFHMAFRTAKRVHTETDICKGYVSVSSIAVEFAGKVFKDLESKTVVLVGAGETGELALKNLVKRGVKDVLVFNRSLERGNRIAEEHGGKAHKLEEISKFLGCADIVISSTGAPHCVITAETVRECISSRHGRPILLIDIAVPRDIEKDVGELENVYLYDIDDLHKVAEENLSRRQEAVKHSWKIVHEEVKEVTNLFSSSSLSDIMKHLDAHALEIEKNILERSFKKESFASMSEEDREAISKLVTKVINKVLAEPKKTLSEATKNGSWEEYARVANNLFNLVGEEDNGKEE